MTASILAVLVTVLLAIVIVPLTAAGSRLDDSVTAVNAAMTAYEVSHTPPPLNDLSPGTTLWNVTRPEGVRTFWVSVPAQYAKINGFIPVLFNFHGLGDNCARWGPVSNFSIWANQPDTAFIYVYPCTVAGEVGWNAGTCCLNNSKVDEVAFVRAIFQSLLDSGARVDKSRVWSTGMSNGGFMTEMLGCQASDIFTGIASVTGDTIVLPGGAQGLLNCDKSYTATSLKVLHIHGTADALVPWNGWPVLQFPAIPLDVQSWALRIGCQNVSYNTWTTGPYHNLIYDQCQTDDSLVEFVIVDGGAHTWFNDKYFRTTDFVVQWFFSFGQSRDSPSKSAKTVELV